MAPAGIISSVPRAGGRAALFVAARWVSPRPSTALLGSATAGVLSPLRPMRGIAAAAPRVGGRGALLARRSGPLHSAMGTAPRLEVAAGGFGARFSAAASSGSLRLAAAAAPPASLLRRGARLLPSAGKSEGNPAQEGVEGTPAPVEGTPAPAPRQGLLSRFTEVGAKLLQEATIVTVCEKAEKFYKFVSHFVPFIIVVIDCFRGN